MNRLMRNNDVQRINKLLKPDNKFNRTMNNMNDTTMDLAAILEERSKSIMMSHNEINSYYRTHKFEGNYPEDENSILNVTSSRVE